MNWKLECFSSICWAILKVIVTKYIYMFLFYLEPGHNLRDDMSQEVTFCLCFVTVRLQQCRWLRKYDPFIRWLSISPWVCSTLTALVKMVRGMYTMKNLRSLLHLFPLPLLDETLSQPIPLWYLDNWPNFQRCEKITNPSCLTSTTGRLHIFAAQIGTELLNWKPCDWKCLTLLLKCSRHYFV